MQGLIYPHLTNLFFSDMLYQMSLQYEKTTPLNTGAGGGTADYAFALMFGMIVVRVGSLRGEFGYTNLP